MSVRRGQRLLHAVELSICRNGFWVCFDLTTLLSLQEAISSIVHMSADQHLRTLEHGRLRQHILFFLQNSYGLQNVRAPSKVASIRTYTKVFVLIPDQGHVLMLYAVCVCIKLYGFYGLHVEFYLVVCMWFLHVSIVASPLGRRRS